MSQDALLHLQGLRDAENHNALEEEIDFHLYRASGWSFGSHNTWKVMTGTSKTEKAEGLRRESSDGVTTDYGRAMNELREQHKKTCDYVKFTSYTVTCLSTLRVRVRELCVPVRSMVKMERLRQRQKWYYQVVNTLTNNRSSKLEKRVSQSIAWITDLSVSVPLHQDDNNYNPWWSVSDLSDDAMNALATLPRDRPFEAFSKTYRNLVHECLRQDPSFMIGLEGDLKDEITSEIQRRAGGLTTPLIHFGNGFSSKASSPGYSSIAKKVIVRLTSDQCIICMLSETRTSKMCPCGFFELKNSTDGGGRAHKYGNHDRQEDCFFLGNRWDRLDEDADYISFPFDARQPKFPVPRGDRDVLASLNLMRCVLHAVLAISRPSYLRYHHRL